MAEPQLVDEPTHRRPPLRVLRLKHPLAIRWFHWVNFPVLVIMIWSGLLIYWAYPAYDLSLFGTKIFHFFPSGQDRFDNPTGFFSPVRIAARPILRADGEPALAEDGTPMGTEPEYWYHLDQRLAEGMAWHFFFMYFFAVNGLLYALYLLFSGHWRYILPNRKSFKQALHVVLHDLRLRKGPLPPQKFNGAQKFAYTGVVLMGLGSVITGIAIFRPIQAPWLTAALGGYGFARVLHFAIMIGFCLFFLVHVAQVARAGWANFRSMVSGYELAPADEPLEA